MADSFGDLDWRDKPAASPGAGSIVQSRLGNNGDFHVVVPWMAGGGLVHWSRDNFNPALPWSGGTMFGDSNYIGAAVAETDYTSHPPTTVKNLDVAAVTSDGRVEIWTRECGGDFRWSLLQVLAEDDGIGAPSLSYTGSCFKTGVFDKQLASHGQGSDLIVYPSKRLGVAFWWCWNEDTGRTWNKINRYYSVDSSIQSVSFSHFDTRTVTGVSAAMFIDRENAIQYSSWKSFWNGHAGVSPTTTALATVFEDGGIKVFYVDYGWPDPVVIDTDYDHHLTIYVDAMLTRKLPDGTLDATPARGRPCAFQSEYLLDEPNGVLAIDQPQVGDLVVMAPARDGGILFWLKNFGDYSDPVPFQDGWSFEYVIGTELYDEVSCVQGNFLRDNGDHNIEITARRADRQGFDQYWCDFHGNWGGPVHVLGEVIGTIRQALTVPSAPPLPAEGADMPSNTLAPPPVDPVAALARIRIDYSVAETDLREWLADAAYTPYPALAAALIAIVRPGRLSKPVQIDVVRGFYEKPGVSSPRKIEDVDVSRLRGAVVSASNERYGTAGSDFQALVLG
jgi:hypothetical protein